MEALFGSSVAWSEMRRAVSPMSSEAGHDFVAAVLRQNLHREGLSARATRLRDGLAHLVEIAAG